MSFLTVVCGTIIAAEIAWIIKFLSRDTKDEKLEVKYNDWED